MSEIEHLQAVRSLIETGKDDSTYEEEEMLKQVRISLETGLYENNIKEEEPLEEQGDELSPPVNKNNSNKTSERYSDNEEDVFNRLFKLSKTYNKTSSKTSSSFTPKIDKNSRKLATKAVQRGSLYDRAVQQRQKIDSAREKQISAEIQERNRSKVSQSSQILAWNRFLKEIRGAFEQVVAFASNNELKDINEAEQVPDDDDLLVNNEGFAQVLSILNMQDAQEELFSKLVNSQERISMNAFCEYLYSYYFPLEGDENDLIMTDSVLIRRLLVGRKAVPSTTSLEKVFREVQEQTPFSPYILEKSRILDQSRAIKMGIDPKLSRVEKIEKEIKVLTEKKEFIKMKHVKREMAECTFQPKTTTHLMNTSKLVMIEDVKKEDQGQQQQDFGSRLYSDSIVRKNRIETKKEEMEKLLENQIKKECTFTPSSSSRKLKNRTIKSEQPAQQTVRSFDSAVQRLSSWREKHVKEEDVLDIKVQEKLNAGKMTRKVRPPPPPIYSRDVYHRQIQQRPQSPPPPPPPVLVQRNQVIFQADVTLPNGQSVEISLKRGEEIRRVVENFAKKYALDVATKKALLQNIVEATTTPNANQQIQEEQEEEEEEEGNYFEIDVVVREGETYTIRFSPNDDPVRFGFEFATEVGMEDVARDNLIDSLCQLCENE